MSGGKFCTCDTLLRRSSGWRRRHWFVLQRKCNHSAFNGYHWTPSRYSGVVCASCNTVWRTTAAYVGDLRDGEYRDGRWVRA